MPSKLTNSDTPRTDKAFNHAATLSTFAHQRRYLMAQMESMERANAKLADEAQVLVNIIRENTRDGVCTLDRDMTIGTRKAIEAARKLPV